jgi:hypothetical protein
MMTASILFWLALPVPGYVLVRRFSPSDLESGLMGTVAISYFYTLALLSPLSILCYLAHLPLWVFSGFIVLCWAAALVEITRRRWWGPTGRLLLAGAGFELLIVALDLVLGARIASFAAGDARVHMARIRFILDHGFSNYDPFVSAKHFFPVYHTNLVHALYAACAQLTRCDLLLVWYDSLPWGELLIYSGSYYMVWRVFDSRAAAWAAALYTVGVRGPFPYLIYPNQLSPYFLTPMMIAFAAEACRQPARWSTAVRLGAGSIIIGQFHGLYVLFCVMAFGPVLGICAAWRLIRRRAGAWLAVACAAALGAGMPFILVSKWKTPAANTAPVGESAAISDSGFFVRTGSGPADWVMRNPANLLDTLGGGVGNSVGWGVGIACALASRRRSRATIVLGIAVTSIAIFYVPPVCTFFLKRLGEEWVMQRFDFIYGVCHIVLVPGAIAYMLDAGASYPVIRAMLSGSALVLGGYMTGHVEPDDWSTLFVNARESTAARRGYVEYLRGIQALLAEAVPRGATILVEPATGIDLTVLGDYHIVMSASASNGVPDLPQRREDLRRMLDPSTPWEARRPLLRKYDIQYFFPLRPPVDWAQGHVERIWKRDKWVIFKLKTD